MSELRPLLSGAEPVAMLQRVARLASRTLCEFCIVDLVEERAQRVRRAEIAHADAGLFDRLRAEAEAFVPRPGGRIERTLASRGPELVTLVRRARTSSGERWKAQRGELAAQTGARAVRTAGEDLDFWESFVPASYMAVPIEVRGEIVAIMTFAASRTPLRFDAERLAFACEVAAWCSLALNAARPAEANSTSPTALPGRFDTEAPTGIRRASKEAG